MVEFFSKLFSSKKRFSWLFMIRINKILIEVWNEGHLVAEIATLGRGRFSYKSKAVG